MLNYLKSTISEWSFDKIEEDIKFNDYDKKRLINISMKEENALSEKVDIILKNSKEKITKQELFQFLNNKQSLKRKKRADILLRAMLLFSVQAVLLIILLNFLISHQQTT